MIKLYHMWVHPKGYGRDNPAALLVVSKPRKRIPHHVDDYDLGHLVRMTTAQLRC